MRGAHAGFDNCVATDNGGDGRGKAKEARDNNNVLGFTDE